MTDKILGGNKWVEIHEKDGWYYSHHPWCKGMGVAILAYKQMNGARVFLGRYESVPCHNGYTKLCSMTGGYDNGDKYTLAQCALNELREEGGYDAPEEAMTTLGYIRPSKASDTIMYLFAVDLDHEGVKTCIATGDGTKGEEGSYVNWVTKRDLILSSDSLNHALLLRLSLAE